jgi:hypothetical protein
LSTVALAFSTDAGGALLVKGWTVGKEEAAPIGLVVRVPLAPVPGVIKTFYNCNLRVFVIN